jgi:hypothetical protein
MSLACPEGILVAAGFGRSAAACTPCRRPAGRTHRRRRAPTPHGCARPATRFCSRARLARQDNCVAGGGPERLKIVGSGRCRPGRPRVSQGCPMQRSPILSVPLSMGSGRLTQLATRTTGDKVIAVRTDQMTTFYLNDLHPRRSRTDLAGPHRRGHDKARTHDQPWH